MKLDELDDMQDTLLALAVYDWYFFHDCRLIGLKKDYNITTKNDDIFRYYHGKTDAYIELNHNRYAKKYKEYLSAMIYA